MHKNTYMTLILMMKKNNLLKIAMLVLLGGCSITPGMHLESQRSNGEDFVYIEGIDKKIKIQNISEADNSNKNTVYKVGNADQISITVWGLPEVFPISNITPDQNLRRVDSNGNIYFPYVGLMKASGKTQNQLREDLTASLSKYFNNPQLDISIARFNSQKVYLLGEVTVPTKLNITDVPLSLAEALGESSGLSTNTSSGSEVYIIRQGGTEPYIFRANLASPAGFVDASNFLLEDNDIVYVNAKGTTRWNRVISQFFPFSTFLNSIDNLTSD